MAALYHPEAFFEDPVFGRINQKRAAKMWEMLCSSDKLDAIDFKILEVDGQEVSVFWEAYYRFGKKDRPVHNKIHARMRIKDGLIIDHKDEFSVYRWATQAIGSSAYLLGWTSFFQKKLRQESNRSLDKFISRT